jgi:hypothetical protein
MSGLSSGQTFYTPDSWFGSVAATGMTSQVASSGSTTGSTTGSSDADSYSTSESEADIPIFFPVPFQELSSVQYYSIEEQLTELTAALKIQFQRHCFIQIRQQETQPMLVPFVEPVTTFMYSRQNLDWYIGRQHERHQALPAAEVDRLLEAQETALLQAAQIPLAAATSSDPDPVESANEGSHPDSKPVSSIWNRTTAPIERKRGPKADVENYAKVARIVNSYGPEWTSDDNLLEICDEFDAQKIPPPKTWISRREGAARSWTRGRHLYPQLVIRAIKDRLEALQKASAAGA